MKIQVGDKVRIKTYEQLIEEYPQNVDSDGDIENIDGDTFIKSGMSELAGLEFVVEECYEDDDYKSVGYVGGWNITEGMVELVEE